MYGKRILLGLTAVLLSFGMVFTACENTSLDTDSDNNSVTSNTGGGGVIDAEIPVISYHPQGGTYTKNAEAILGVTATKSDSGTLSYQWYKNTKNSNIGGTSLTTSGAKTASYKPSTTTVGTVYYYVVVTNTNNSASVTKIATATSNTAEIIVNNLVNTAVPTINTHPKDAMYEKDVSPEALTITATKSDSGTLSYQWYSNTANSNSGGTPIVDALSASYSPSTGTEGEFYYYAVVTNTNNSANGTKEATRTSNTAKIVIYAMPFTDAAMLSAYLGAMPSNTAATPYKAELSGIVSLSDVYNAVASGKKYIDLDLSGVTLSDVTSTWPAYSSGDDTAKSYIITIILPDTVTSINDGISYNGAFYRFSRLTSVSGKNIETVGNYAFDDCSAITTVNFTKATSIGKYAFNNCLKITTLSLPKAASIGDYAFYGYNANYTSLTAVNLPEATSIGNYAFYNCPKINAVSLPKAISIGKYAFNSYAVSNTALTALSLPKATSIDDYAFSQCTAITTLSLPEAISFGKYAFSSCKALTALSLPKATSFGEHAFAFCESLETVELTVATDTGTDLFYSCTALTTAILPEATTIGDRAFIDCKAMTAITLPKATSIGRQTFSYCSVLTTVNLPEATSFSGGLAFSDCKALTTITLPKATSIGESTFQSCDALTTVILPEATSVGKYAFSPCPALTRVELPNAESIVADAFKMTLFDGGGCYFHSCQHHSKGWHSSASGDTGGLVVLLCSTMQ
jgi:hypothetical protein